MIAGNQTITVNGGAGAVATYIGGASRNSFQGTFQVNGILAANSNMNVAGAEVNLGSAGTFDMRGNWSTVAGLVGSAGSSVTSSSATNRALTIGGSGNYTFGGVISNGASGITSLWVAMNYRAQSGGVQTLSANNTFNGTTTIDSGTLVLDYSSANGGKLNSSSLTFRAGTIELVGGNYTENVGNMTIAGTSVSGGMVNMEVRSFRLGP